MKQITIISGKGGTGKTTLTASLASLIDNKVMADCDVDAADLHLILKPKIRKRTEFYDSKIAYIDPELCTQCGLCEEYCHYKAITDFVVDPVACEGCALCEMICPARAVEMKTNLSGEWYISDTRYGPMVHAKLKAGEENSGKLVTIVRNETQKIAEEQNKDFVIIDGPPGIGCPVISSISGVDLVVAVTEPTVSGIHDLERVLQIAGQFKVPAMVVINKYDINEEMTQQIVDFCTENSVPVIGKILFDPAVVESQIHELPVVEFSDNGVSGEMKKIWQEIMLRIND